MTPTPYPPPPRDYRAARRAWRAARRRYADAIVGFLTQRVGGTTIQTVRKYRRLYEAARGHALEARRRRTDPGPP